MREQLSYQIRTQIGFAAKNLRKWFHTKSQTQRRIISGGLGLAMVALLMLVAAMPMITSASEMDALSNGGFEQGFTHINGCGAVGNRWDCFTNGGAANYGFYDDQWEATVYEGKSSQLIEINTKEMAAGDNDRYAGISQTTRVVPGAPYKFSMNGMIRTTNKEGDPWRYVVQVGWLGEPQGDWKDVTNWVDIGWNTYYNRTEPGGFSAFQTQLVPNSEFITVFIRVWKKWGVPYEELDVNLDAISLSGPAANRPHDGGKHEAESTGGTGGPVAGQDYRPEQFQPQGQPQQEAQQHPQPQAQESRPQEYPQTYRPHERNEEYPVSCSGQDLIYNGSFEDGFNEVPWGDVGKGWEAFTNGGAANYGFYDEQWDVVVADGNHGQLIEINSNAIYPADPDRYAGISQRIGGLHPGATYELTLRGGLRGVGNEDDPYRFAAQWGLGNDGGWQSVDEWTEMDLGPIGVRTQPLPLAQYTMRFEAPAQSVVLFIRGWKKWAITNVEMDFNLDAISLQACDSRGSEKPQGGWQEPQYPGTGGPENRPGNQGQGNPCYNPCGNNQGSGHDNGYDDGHEDGYDHDNHNGGGQCTYVVESGDTLSQIAVDYGVSLEDLAHANDIVNPSTIFVGQELMIPGCSGGKEAYGPVNQMSNTEVRPAQEWEIVQGERPEDTLARVGPALLPSVEEHGFIEQIQVSEVTYTVQPGDMLSFIAEAYNVSAYTLASHNGIENTDIIYTSQVLAIPN